MERTRYWVYTFVQSAPSPLSRWLMAHSEVSPSNEIIGSKEIVGRRTNNYSKYTYTYDPRLSGVELRSKLHFGRPSIAG